MSSIVSRRPDVCSVAGSDGSPMNQRNEAFWMSMRLGTSRTRSSLENVLRLLGAVISGKAALLPRGTKGEKEDGSLRTNGGATGNPISEGPEWQTGSVDGLRGDGTA